VSNGAAVTITLPSVSDQIVVQCTSNAGTSTAVLLVGVTTGGVAATERIGLTAGAQLAADVKLKQIVLGGGGADMGYQVFCVLSRTASADYPDITAANGFSGVE
tara:strand:+ start:18199 stop:18510 length:312 start_codon:yes stop_codon:yes gene_type:complete